MVIGCVKAADFSLPGWCPCGVVEGALHQAIVANPVGGVPDPVIDFPAHGAVSGAEILSSQAASRLTA